MLDQNEENCPECGKPLLGVIEITREQRNTIFVIVLRETNDCNWSECLVCREVFCKACCDKGHQPQSVCRRCWKNLLDSSIARLPHQSFGESPTNQKHIIQLKSEGKQ